MRFRTERERDDPVRPLRLGGGCGVRGEAARPNWIGRLEYLHYDFGQVEQVSTAISNLPIRSSPSEPAAKPTTSSVRALSYKFGTLAAASPVPYAKAPAIATAMSSWAGFYLGVHGGYGWGENKYSDPWSFTPLASITGPSLKGAVYGGHAGYNWQFDRAVAGFELDFSGTDIKGTSPSSFAGAESAIKLDQHRLSRIDSRAAGLVAARQLDALRHRGSRLGASRQKPAHRETPLPPVRKAFRQARLPTASAGSLAPAWKPCCPAATGSAVSNICTTISARSNRSGLINTNIFVPSPPATIISTSYAPACPTSSVIRLRCRRCLTRRRRHVARGDQLGRILSRRPRRLWLEGQ